MEQFLVGASTAAHQVEGNNLNSDFWAMEHMKNTTFSEPSLLACDHYRRYESDIALMAKAGLNAYRFSVEWARIEPDKGEFSQAELLHYHDVVRCCRRYGIEPVVTLHHFSSPRWLIAEGGWEAPAVTEYFVRYVKRVIAELGEDVRFVCTINEANMGRQIMDVAKAIFSRMAEKQMAEGKLQVGLDLNALMRGSEQQRAENMAVFGTETPNTFLTARTDEGDRLIFETHVKAREAIRETAPWIKVGLTLSLHDVQPLAGGEKFAREQWHEQFSRYLPYLKDDDFFGLQNYSRALIGADGGSVLPEGAKLTQMGYENYPESLEHVIRRVSAELPVPILVTENGIATADDKERVEFLEKVLKGVSACKEQLPLLGYLHWSFCDNFEWQKGFGMQFGLVAVDRETMQRTPKPSLEVLGAYARRVNARS